MSVDVVDETGQDMDIWGGGPTVASLLPDPQSDGNDCVLNEEGRCPIGCGACVAFVLSLDPAGIIDHELQIVNS